MSTTSQFITLRAFRPRTQQKITLRPCEDRTGKVFTGQGEHGYWETLSEEEKKRLVPLITPETAISVTDGTVLNLSNPIDKANWEWMKKHPYIKLKKDGSFNRDAVFYVDDPVNDAQVRVESTAKIDKARYMVRETSQEKQVFAAEVLGLTSAKSMTPSQVTDWLLSKANEAPVTVMEAINPSNEKRAKATVWFNKAVQWNVIERGRDSIYRFGGDKGTALGYDQDSAIDFLIDPANSEIVKVMKARLTETIGPDTAVSEVPVSTAEHVI